MLFAVVSGFLVVLAAAIVTYPLLELAGEAEAIRGRERACASGQHFGEGPRGHQRRRAGDVPQGERRDEPVLLYLHGGMPEYFLTERYPTGLEAEFIVCWWEQRGSGLSYRPGMPAESVTVEQLVADTLAVTNYLRRRFGRTGST